jgi:hypothetical protein
MFALSLYCLSSFKLDHYLQNKNFNLDEVQFTNFPFMNHAFDIIPKNSLCDSKSWMFSPMLFSKECLVVFYLSRMA